MIIVNEVSELPESVPLPCGLTIGSYDGLHKGHQLLLENLRSKIGKQGTLVVFTFSNHPSEIVRTRDSTPLICSPSHKLLLLEKLGVDIVILQKFSAEFSSLSFDQFLKNLKQKLPFSHLMLGVGASFGQDRKGDETQVKALSKELDFTADYIEKCQVEDYIISSDLIRNFIKQGELEKIALCLGRPYSIYNPLLKNPKKPHELMLSLEGMCLLPEKEHKVRLQNPQRTVEGKARVDRHMKQLLLHLPSLPSSLIGSMVEVFFLH